MSRVAIRKSPKEAVNKLPVQTKFKLMREDMALALIEREDEIDVVLTALICQEHPLLVGPPGTAKSLLLDSLMEWMGGSRFSILFTKFTTPEEVFGPISVQGLKEDKSRRVTTGKLAEATTAFADEIFKASSAILNTMLRILNEKLYENGDGSFRKVPLRICVAASNEWPNDQEGGKELGALFDRFLFRKTVRPISPSGRARLFDAAVDGVGTRPELTTSISPDEIDQAHREAMELLWAVDAKLAFADILEQLNKEGIFPGDRRTYKAVSAVRAYAYLNGAEQVEKEHLEILAHVLWDDPAEQPVKCAKIVTKIANPINSLVLDKLAQVQDILDKFGPTESVPKLQVIQKELAEAEAISSGNVRVKQARGYVQQTIKKQLDKSMGV